MNIKQKITTAVVALTTVAMLAPMSAGAVTVAELQAQINALLAQLQTLQGTTSTTPSACVGVTFTSQLAVGSTGVEVKCLQVLLNVTPQSGYFGPLTLAAVKNYQMQQFGYSVNWVGPGTRAKLNAWVSGGMTVPTTPTPGCPAGALFNSMTGASCTSTPTTPTTPTGLVGGAGDITVSGLSSYASQNVGEGESNVKVVAFEVEADSSSDVAITSMKVEAHQESSADDRDMVDYMQNVSLWMESTEIGRANTSEFSDAATTNTWVKSITTSNAIVRAGQKVKFYIAVSANSKLDSGDINSDDWHIGVSSIRFLDGAGVTTTESVTLDVTDDTVDETIEQQFNFATFATAAAVELKVALNDADKAAVNEEHLINAKAGASDNDDIAILSFTMEAKGSDIEVQELPVVITTSGETDEAVLLKAVHLYRGSTKLGSETVPTGGAVTFDNLDFTITKGNKDAFQIRVDVQDLTGALDEGDGVKAEMTSGVLDGGIIAKDAVSENLSSSEISGSALGEESVFRDTGFSIALVSTSATLSHQGDIANASDHDRGTFKITFDVTAWDGDVYIDKTTPTATGGSTEADLDFTGSPTLTSASIVCDTGCTGTNGFKVGEGETDRFTITSVLTPTADGLHDMSLTDLIWAITDVDGTLQFTYNLDAFKTSQLFLNLDQ